MILKAERLGFGLMSGLLLPDIYADTVYDIELEVLKNEGIRGFVFDIDNTLVTYAEPIANEKVAAWLKRLKESGFKIYIVSNNDKERVRIFSESIGAAHFGKALKPLGFYLRRACKNMGIKPCETALVGDQLFTDICGGNRLKMKTILVKPISDVEDSFVKFKRRFERCILNRAAKREV